MNIYCIIKENDSVRKIQLSQELQNNLYEYLNQYIKEIEQKVKVTFSGEYKPEEDQVLLIENFQNPLSYFVPLTTENLAENEIESIKTLVFTMNDGKIAYQSFDNRKIIRPEKWFLIYSGDTYSKIDHKGLVIDNKIDAIYHNNQLLFSSYHNASKIFNLSDYYREATDKEIDSFIKDEIVEIKGGEVFDKNLLNSRMRKKLYIICKNRVLEKVKDNFDAVVSFSEKFGISSCFDRTNKKVILSNDKKDFETLIKFLNDDLYNSPITGENYETNSKKIIPAQNKK